jgi:hypothetical protein
MDKRIKEVIISELKTGDFGTLLFEAILKLNDKDFLPLLTENLNTVKNDMDTINKGWLLALEGTVEELENRIEKR